MERIRARHPPAPTPGPRQAPRLTGQPLALGPQRAPPGLAIPPTQRQLRPALTGRRGLQRPPLARIVRRVGPQPPQPAPVPARTGIPMFAPPSVVPTRARPLAEAQGDAQVMKLTTSFRFTRAARTLPATCTGCRLPSTRPNTKPGRSCSWTVLPPLRLGDVVIGLRRVARTSGEFARQRSSLVFRRSLNVTGVVRRPSCGRPLGGRFCAVAGHARRTPADGLGRYDWVDYLNARR